MTAGYDPYRYVTYRENEEYEHMSRRPLCDTCGEIITGESAYVVGDVKYCEECFESAISTLRKGLLPLVEKAYKNHKDRYIVIDLVESIVDNFDFLEWETDHEEVLE